MSSAHEPLGAGARRRPFEVFRAELERVGFRPSKTLGQNFLVDPNAARSIAGDAGLEPGARVLEVGAGCGFLTQQLVELGLEVLAVEIDARLLDVARRLLGARDNVTWLHADALAGKHALEPRLVDALPRSPWHVVANLPYSISAPLLVLLSRLEHAPGSITVLVQDEVAARITARPGTPEWGALSARLGLRYRARPGRAVGAQLFWPRPRVASRVVHLEQHSEATGSGATGSVAMSSEEVGHFDALVGLLFGQRRKQLLGVLGGSIGRPSAADLLAEHGLDPRARAEGLDLAQLQALACSPAWRGRPEAQGP